MSSYTVSLAKGKLAYSRFGHYAFAALTSGLATGMLGKKPWNALIAYLSDSMKSVTSLLLSARLSCRNHRNRDYSVISLPEWKISREKACANESEQKDGDSEKSLILLINILSVNVRFWISRIVALRHLSNPKSSFLWQSLGEQDSSLRELRSYFPEDE